MSFAHSESTAPAPAAYTPRGWGLWGVTMSIHYCGLVAIMLLSGGSLAEAQVRTIAGRVVDAYTGRAIAAGRVWIKGTSIADKLRPDGVFVLRAPAPAQASEVVLVADSDGYRRREVVVSAGQGTVSIALRADIPELAPVVVVAGATATRRRNSAHSSVGLGGHRIGRVPAANVIQALQGKVPGANVQQNSGVPGGDVQLTLRGVTTLLGPASPLYVVDGVIVSNESAPTGISAVTGGFEPRRSRIVDLNPNDIASIEVLKGAAASAMYGSKGSNGVVVITTKRGRR